MNAKMRSLIQTQEICVLATSGPQGPHTSLMAYLAAEDSTEIYLVTKPDTLKCENIKVEPRVSLLIDDRRAGAASELRALTIGGRAEEVVDTRSEAELLARFSSERPLLCSIAADPGSKVLRVSVEKLRLVEGPTKITYEELT